MRAGRDLPAPDYQLLFESAPGLYLVLATDLTIVGASDAYLEATMTRRDEIVGRGLFTVFPDNPDDPAASGERNLRSSLERVLAHGKPDTMAVQKYDVRRPGTDGVFEARYWSPVNAPVFDHEGSIAYILHRVEDVTDFVRAKFTEDSTTELDATVRARAVAMGAEVYRRAQEIQDANQELRGLHAILEARVQARTLELQDSNAELERQVAALRRTEAALKQTEEQFHQAQKMEAIGRLAGGVAHDFNNLLSVILVYSESLRADLGAAHPASTGLEQIHRAGERAAELTGQLLAFGRKQVLEPKVLDLNESIRGIDAMMRRLLGEDVELRTSLDGDLGRVQADPGRIDQVLMNLVVNARDAMPEGGELTISTANVDVDAELAQRMVDARPGAHVRLSVGDTGVGMDRATRERIFEPFFTTKERGKGTGLGLSTVFGIVSQSGGFIDVRSQPRVGTTFDLYLPRVDAVPPRPLVTVDDASGSTPTETILLVEDEDQLRALGASILEKSGYAVLTARDGAEALRICAVHPGQIDMLLTDVIMPGMNGRELADEAGALRPDMRVLYMSGYTDSVILDRGVRGDDVAFLQKPLTTRALREKVREVLDRSS